jgi:hypothetical protein
VSGLVQATGPTTVADPLLMAQVVPVAPVAVKAQVGVSSVLSEGGAEVMMGAGGGVVSRV